MIRHAILLGYGTSLGGNIQRFNMNAPFASIWWHFSLLISMQKPRSKHFHSVLRCERVDMKDPGEQM